MIRPVRLPLVLPSVFALLFAATGCRENPVEYRVTPKEAAAPASTGAAPHGPMGGSMAAAPAAAPNLEWTAPADWTSKPASEMRLASFSYTAPGGELADISIFVFPDAAGGLLANINRWRGQVGLEPVADTALETTATRTQIAGQEAWLVDLSGTPKASAPAMGSTPPPTGLTRITGAIVPLQGRAWFFKLMGPDAIVLSQRENFQKFVASIRVVAAPSTPASAAPMAATDPHAGIPGAPPVPGMAGAAGAADPHAGIAGAPALGPTAGAMDPSAIAAPPAPPAGFTFETPTGWVAQPGSQFRLASFKVAGSGVPDADVSVTNFPGTVGGDFANINRWRGQLGLAPISEADFASSVTRIAGQHGMEFVVADLESTQPMLEGGHRARMLAAILKMPDSTFFFKMTGETAHVAGQREAFNRFLQSFHLEDGHAH